jgi:3-oxoacyl-[acyl-carrier protein] reductase
MNVDLNGRAALVTGASRGMGREIALGLARCGADVAVNYLTGEEEAEQVASEISRSGRRSVLVRADVADAEQVRQMFERVLESFEGRLDILVNNAGTMVKRCKIEDMDDETFQRVVDVNFKGTFLCCRAAIPIMTARASQGRPCCIVNLSSVAARTGGGGGAVAYAGAKAAVSTFTRGLAKELAREGIRVNAVAPGVIYTRFHQLFSTPERLEQFKRTIPVGRLGAPEDIVGAVLYLVSDDASYVTGAEIEVNGGM